MWTPGVRSTDLPVSETGILVSTLFAEGRIFPTEDSLLSFGSILGNRTTDLFLLSRS